MFKAGDVVVSVSDNDLDISVGDEFVVISSDPLCCNFKDRAGDKRSRPCSYYKLKERAPLEDPVEYLKRSFDAAESFSPSDMLEKCFGIKRAERTSYEWVKVESEPLKVGDRVKIVGHACNEVDIWGRCKEGSLGFIDKVDDICKKFPYRVDNIWYPASSVERA